MTTSDARSGANFLTPGIAKLVWRELAYRERGALFDEERLWGNLLSSSALVFNLFAPLKLDLSLARKVLRAAFKLDVKTVAAVYFETSPGRGDERFIGDATALDVLIVYTDSKCASAFVGIEVKYAETTPANASPVKARLAEVAAASGLFRDASDPALHRPPLRQFFAEHSLCATMTKQKGGEFERGSFIVVLPALNAEIDGAVRTFRSHLSERSSDVLPFSCVSVESIIEAMASSGEKAISAAFHERYLDQRRLVDLIEGWAPPAA